ncbi:hypothetical protein N431DRAFT_482072 [Stipitochalara longipes BDJ]|nr:hypothetical protein N431DRAFT_482072 [Stipitochalara longipes BDJ]
MSTDIPSLYLQPLSVDFIDSRLSDFHDAFKNSQSQYDHASGHYIPTKMQAPSPAAEAEADEAEHALPVTARMAFWAKIFPQCMEEFKDDHPKEPNRRLKGVDYSIRDKTNWEDIYSRLQEAREFYDGDKRGFWGRYEKGKRWVIDHSGPLLQQGIKFVPKLDYTSPVVAAVQVFLDAAETTSEVRDVATKSFDSEDIERTFTEIEIFLATFPKASRIKKASIKLVAVTFKAIEDAIGFFLKSDFKKATSVIIRGKDYQKHLLESIDKIRTCSDQLFREAQNLGNAKSREDLVAIRSGTAEIFLMHKKTGEKLDGITENLDEYKVVIQKGFSQSAAENAAMKNEFLSLINDGQKKQEKMYQEQKQWLNDHVVGQLTELRQQIGEIQGAKTPDLEQQLPPQQPFSHPWPGQLPMSAPSQPQYALQNTLFPPFLPPDLLKLLLWPLLQHQQPAPGPAQTQAAPRPPLNTASLLKLLKVPLNFAETDLVAILESSASIPLIERRKADLVVTTKQFRNWLMEPTSCELLVHGDLGLGGRRSSPRYVSALSRLCALLAQALHTKGKSYVPLVFFCGSHVEDDDRHRGGRAIMRSFITQLLAGWDLFDAVLQQADDSLDLNIEGLRKGKLAPLCALFRWLVCRLPQGVTLICIVDGISHYETDEFEDGMLRVLRCLLGLARDTKMAAVVKVLATSPAITDLVQDEFKEDDSCFLSLAEIRQAGQAAHLPLLAGRLDDESEDSDSLDSDDSEDWETGDKETF